jgi:hypothetical protein
MSGSLPPPKWDTSLVGRSLRVVARRVPLAAAIFGMVFERPQEAESDAHPKGGVYKQERK